METKPKQIIFTPALSDHQMRECHKFCEYFSVSLSSSELEMNCYHWIKYSPIKKNVMKERWPKSKNIS